MTEEVEEVTLPEITIEADADDPNGDNDDYNDDFNQNGLIELYEVDWRDISHLDWERIDYSSIDWENIDAILITDLPDAYGSSIEDEIAARIAIQSMGKVASDFFAGLLNVRDPGFHASGVATLNDVMDRIAIESVRNNLSRAQFNTIVDRLGYINGAIAIGLEAPEVIQAWEAEGFDAAMHQFVGAVSSAVGGYVGATVGAFIALKLAAFLAAPQLLAAAGIVVTTGAFGYALSNISEFFVERYYNFLAEELSSYSAQEVSFEFSFIETDLGLAVQFEADPRMSIVQLSNTSSSNLNLDAESYDGAIGDARANVLSANGHSRSVQISGGGGG